MSSARSFRYLASSNRDWRTDMSASSVAAGPDEDLGSIDPSALLCLSCTFRHQPPHISHKSVLADASLNRNTEPGTGRSKRRPNNRRGVSRETRVQVM